MIRVNRSSQFSSVLLAPSLVHVPELVRLHLAEPQDGVLALAAVVVRLLAVVRAPRHRAELRRRELLEAGGHDRVELLVLPPVRHHLVGVRAVVVALEAVEMRRALLRLAWQGHHCNDIGLDFWSGN